MAVGIDVDDAGEAEGGTEVATDDGGGTEGAVGGAGAEEDVCGGKSFGVGVEEVGVSVAVEVRECDGAGAGSSRASG